MFHRKISVRGQVAAILCLFLMIFSPQTGWADDETSVLTQQEESGFFIVQSSRSDVSPELNSLKPLLLKDSGAAIEQPEIPSFILPKTQKQPQETAQLISPNLSNLGPTSPIQMPEPLFNFNGISNRFNGWPPDTQGDIGPNHYIQWINLHFSIWQLDKVNLNASLVYGPVPGTTLFQGFGGACEFNNDGDPITLYDPFADRWFMSQFALPYYPNSPFYQCVAVSTSPNPLGSWYRYEYLIPSGKMNDYPKFGVWPNAYFMTVNQFNSGTSSWGGAGVAALERSAMLAGLPARMIFLDLYSVNSGFGGMLPADFDGVLPPPDGAPGYFMEWDDSSWMGGADGLRLWEFHLDWDHPDEAIFGLSGLPNWFIPTTNVDPSMCNFSRNCISQPGTTTKLDAIADRLMYRLQYRNFGSYSSLVSNHTVDVDGTDHAGIHWFEVRKGALDTDWSLYQDGIFAPDSANRWMGSAALDHVGNMGLGYSVSSTSIYPSVRYTGRLAGDPLGSMLQGETSLIAGSGSQTGSSRWGDYSMMGVDPIDDCTFWYTQQYVAQTGSNTWTTRIGAFRFPGCVIGDQGVIQGTVRSSPDSTPIDGAQVQASSSITQTLTTLSDSNGIYSIQAPVGVYTVTASAFGYYPQVETGVEIFSDTVTSLDFSLETAPNQTISGFVMDAEAGWPLYAKIKPIGIITPTIWSDPATGYYSITIPTGSSFTLSVEPFSDGYIDQSIPISNLNDDLTLDFDMQVDADTCTALGYQPQITPIFMEDFEADLGGLTASGITSWTWGEITSGPGEAHSGSKGWATGINGNYSNYENGLLTLPPIDLSLISGQSPALGWWQWLETEARFDFASIEVSKDGGASWQTVYGPVSGQVDLDWKYHYVTLDPGYAVSNLQIRFRFTSDSNLTYLGWYLDDITVGSGSCQPADGGLIAGNVLDANTLIGLNGAVVFNESGVSAYSLPTPEDFSLADGFYTLFSPSGTNTFTATYQTDYQEDIRSVEIPLFGAVRQDFELEAGLLEYSPPELSIQLELGETADEHILLENKGGAASSFEWVELRGTHLPLGPIEEPLYGNKPFKADLLTAERLGIPSPAVGVPLSAGQVLQSWIPQDVIGAWAAAYDKENQTVWVSSPSMWWGGVDRLFEFEEIGTPTGRNIPHSLTHISGPGDLAYNWNSGKIWVMNINTGVSNCIYEVDPQSGYTGMKICPGGTAGFSLSQRGLAYDPFSDTWFAGGWNDQMVHHFDGDGTILSSINVGLPISGLAYQPESQHLYAITSESMTRVFVLDAANNYEQLGQFQVSEGFGAYAGGGLEIDCSGSLWGVDINENRVVQFESGESATFCDYDIPWIEAQPVSGSADIGAVQPITISFDAGISAIDQPGTYNMLFKLSENTPYIVPNLPITMTVTPPSGWGKLNGNIQSLGYCDADPQPLDDALVTIITSQGETWSASSDDTGYYQRWLDELGGPFTVTVTAPGYAGAQVSSVDVTGGLTTTVDFDLEWQQACTRVDPQTISETVKIGRLMTTTLNLENAGHAETPFTIVEVHDFYSAETDVDWISLEPAAGTLAADPDPVQVVASLNAGAQSIIQPGIYTAGLVLETQDPMFPIQQIPVTMTVAALEYGLQLSAPITETQAIPGETVEYSIVITNTSEGMPDTFHLQMLGSDWVGQLSTPVVGPMASGESASVVLSVTVPDSVIPLDQDTLTVRAISQGDPEKSAALDFTTTVLEPSADLTLSMSAPMDPYQAGVEITYQITVTNQGPTGAPGVIYVNMLSPRFYYLSDSASCDFDGGLLICRLGWLNAGEVRLVTISGFPIRTGILLNQGAVVSDAADPYMTDNFAAFQAIVEGLLYYLPWVTVD